MSDTHKLALQDAADRAVDLVNRLIDESPTRLIYVAQMRRSVGAVSAQVAAGFGRGSGPERKHNLRMAKGEAEETIKHLRANWQSGRLENRKFWSIRDLLITITKMITALLPGADAV
jgi:four helix bundle protein